jgi:hypothetical protein
MSISQRSGAVSQPTVRSPEPGRPRQRTGGEGRRESRRVVMLKARTVEP